MIILLSIVILSALIFSSSPLNLSLSLAGISTMISLYSYQMTGSVFVPCAIIISFSSGMMILFSYCSILSLHEANNNISPSIIMFISTLFFSCLATNPLYSTELSSNIITEIPTTVLLAFLITVVVISIVCINITFFNPTNNFIQSY